MDTLQSRAEPLEPLQDSEPISRPDALAALRACGELALRVEETPPTETCTRLLALTLAYLGTARGMLIMANTEHEASGALSTRKLAHAGLSEYETAALLTRVAVPLTQRDESTDAPGLLEWAICPLPSIGTATPVLIAACEPASLNCQQRTHAALEVIASGVAATVAAALREERRIRDDAAAEHLKAELIGTVSHELRSPLAAVTGYASTLLRYDQRLSRHERQEFLRAILTAGERLVSHIDRMLAMSQLAAGEMPFQMAPVDLAQLAREALATTSPPGAREGSPRGPITLRMHVAYDETDEPVPLVWADARRLRDVLDHLIENAIKYSPDGGEIEITLRRAPPSALRLAAATGMLHQDATTLPDMIELRVSDRGVGIPPEHLGRIFERFHRVDTRLTRVADGLGLGLAICKRIIELHGGAIWSESTLGVGSAFHIVLPVIQTTNQEAGDEAEPF